MIARLTGTLIEKCPQSIIIDVNGVGYEALCSLETYQYLPKTGETASVQIHTHVREDESILFAFFDVREKQIFQRLIRVNGVGPRLALNILSGISADKLIEALRAEDLLRITAIPGVGKKTGERLILDLKDKLLDIQGSISSTTGTATPPLYEDLLSVLQNLGYKRITAEKALRDLSFSEGTSLQEAVRQTLKQLGNVGQNQKSLKAGMDS
jgi:Holliday junction DNA helicase RuvA